MSNTHKHEENVAYPNSLPARLDVFPYCPNTLLYIYFTASFVDDKVKLSSPTSRLHLSVQCPLKLTDSLGAMEWLHPPYLPVILPLEMNSLQPWSKSQPWPPGAKQGFAATRTPSHTHWWRCCRSRDSVEWPVRPMSPHKPKHIHKRNVQWKRRAAHGCTYIYIYGAYHKLALLYSLTRIKQRNATFTCMQNMSTYTYIIYIYIYK